MQRVIILPPPTVKRCRVNIDYHVDINGHYYSVPHRLVRQEIEARVPRLLEELRIAHGDGSFGKRLVHLARLDVLILDDWGITPLDQSNRHDLLEVIDDRVAAHSTIITSQLPVDHWHGWVNDPPLADAILDRIVHRSHRITLKGESLRKKEPPNEVKNN